MSPDGVEEMTKLQLEPTRWISTVEPLRKEAETSAQQGGEQVNNVFHTTTKAEHKVSAPSSI